ncbi:MAG: Z1 domain-containing protein, partial [Syntrophales bacterium]
IASIRNGEVAIDVVNSDNDVKQMLDENGQLRLRVPMNIFIGGQALDRGITIDNLIGFYYGRNPGRYQQDTVLQHSRMYGNRSREDLSVTRFYTTGAVHVILRRINEIDEILRNALKAGGGDHGIVFIQKDSSGKIIPCSPNKVLLSSTTTLRPWKRLLPVGFDLHPAYKIKSHTAAVDKIVGTAINSEEPVLVTQQDAKTIIQESFACFDPDKSTDIGSSEAEMLSALTYLSGKSGDEKVYILVRGDRNVSRMKPGEEMRFENSPYTGKNEGEMAKRFATDIPVLILLKQNGGQEKGWRSGPFWWPVIVAQKNIQPAIYASETREWSSVDFI